MARMKIDLSVSPSFYSPPDKRAAKLDDILKDLFKKDLDVMAITSCQTLSGEPDTRWRHYTDQLFDSYFNHSPIPGGWQVGEIISSGGFATLVSPEGDRKHLIHTQKVRALEGQNPAYLLVSGFSKAMEPGKPIEKTAEEVKDHGGLVLACDPVTESAPSLEKCLELWDKELIDGVQISATNSMNYNLGMIRILQTEGIKAFPASNAKHHRYAGTSYAQMDIPVFDIDQLVTDIKGKQFETFYGQLGRWADFRTRKWPVLASGPGHLLAGGKRRDEWLRCVGLRK